MKFNPDDFNNYSVTLGQIDLEWWEGLFDYVDKTFTTDGKLWNSRCECCPCKYIGNNKGYRLISCEKTHQGTVLYTFRRWADYHNININEFIPWDDPRQISEQAIQKLLHDNGMETTYQYGALMYLKEIIQRLNSPTKSSAELAKEFFGDD